MRLLYFMKVLVRNFTLIVIMGTLVYGNVQLFSGDDEIQKASDKAMKLVTMKYLNFSFK